MKKILIFVFLLFSIFGVKNSFAGFDLKVNDVNNYSIDIIEGLYNTITYNSDQQYINMYIVDQNGDYVLDGSGIIVGYELCEDNIILNTSGIYCGSEFIYELIEGYTIETYGPPSTKVNFLNKYLNFIKPNKLSALGGNGATYSISTSGEIINSPLGTIIFFIIGIIILSLIGGFVLYFINKK